MLAFKKVEGLYVIWTKFDQYISDTIVLVVTA